MKDKARKVLANLTNPSTVLVLSAASGMVYEIAVINIVFYFLKQNSYSTSIVVSVFLTGLGIGSYVIHKNYLNARSNPNETLFRIQFAVALYGLLILSNLENILNNIDRTTHLLAIPLLILIPTSLLGAVFPLCGELVKKNEKVGYIYAVDLVGAVAGTLLAGLVLIPYFGSKLTILFAVSINILLAMKLIKNAKFKLLATLLILLIFFINTTLLAKGISEVYKPVTIKEVDGEESTTSHRKVGDINFEVSPLLNFNKPSPYGQVKIRNNTLYINRRDQCSIAEKYELGELTVAEEAVRNTKKENPKVLNIGLGCGETAAKITEYTNEQVDVVEINPVVIEAAGQFSDIEESDHVKIINQDGLFYLKDNKRKYNAIVVDIENPAILHSSNLYTAEAFDEVLKSLHEDGIFGLWRYQCKHPGVDDILFNTLKNSFNYIYAPHPNVFIATNKKLDLDEYSKKSATELINTQDHKHLSRVYLESCSNWFKKEEEQLFE